MRAAFKRAAFTGGFVCGAAAGAATCVAVMRVYVGERGAEEAVNPVHRDIGEYGLPLAGAETRYYANHILSYDQSRRTPRWVAEHLSQEKLHGTAQRKHCKFKPDPSIPVAFTAHNEDYLGSGWSRGHMAPAGDNKASEQSMAETFYLSNIVPQNYENNAGFWNRLEMYCRDLTKKFEDVWIVSGPLALPEVGSDGRKSMCYRLIGKDNVMVPTHLFKVVLARENPSSDTLAIGAFVVPNQPIGFDHPLTEYQVRLSELERMAGLSFFPGVRPEQSVRSLCEVDACRLMDVKEFTLYVAGRKVAGARTSARLEKVMTELRDAAVTPDDYLLKLYQEKKEQLALQERSDGKRE
ncbi:nuclease EXOG, mitochondrial [Denticeps clupeoides]|uniref:Nuclease EXOG, mitochondrial n=1 Tax=Denticeps clupeoides TaxID=299321 RepID=A0AAY4AAD6_9TELE|nr:nuclease EXOG, mitochondrial [Denticeps clupeoides]